MRSYRSDMEDNYLIASLRICADFSDTCKGCAFNNGYPRCLQNLLLATADYLEKQTAVSELQARIRQLKREIVQYEAEGIGMIKWL